MRRITYLSFVLFCFAVPLNDGHAATREQILSRISVLEARKARLLAQKNQIKNQANKSGLRDDNSGGPAAVKALSADRFEANKRPHSGSVLDRYADRKVTRAKDDHKKDMKIISKAEQDANSQLNASNQMDQNGIRNKAQTDRNAIKSKQAKTKEYIMNAAASEKLKAQSSTTDPETLAKINKAIDINTAQDLDRIQQDVDAELKDVDIRETAELDDLKKDMDTDKAVVADDVNMAKQTADDNLADKKQEADEFKTKTKKASSVVDGVAKVSSATEDAKALVDAAKKVGEANELKNTIKGENAAFAQMRQMTDRHNKNVDAFYKRYHSDPAFKEAFDKSGKRKPSHIMPLKEASDLEKLGLDSPKAGLQYVANFMNDSSSALSFTEYVKPTRMSNNMKNLSNKGGKALGTAGAVLQTGIQTYEANSEAKDTGKTLRNEKSLYADAELKTAALRNKQVLAREEVKDEFGGDWRKYAASKNKKFETLPKAEQDAIADNLKRIGEQDIKDLNYTGYSITKDTDITGSLDAGVSATPLVGTVYGAAKDGYGAAKEGLNYSESRSNVKQANSSQAYAKKVVGNAENVKKNKLRIARDGYMKRIAEVKKDPTKATKHGLTLPQMEDRLLDIEYRLMQETP